MNKEFIQEQYRGAYKIARKLLRGKYNDPLCCEIHDYFDSENNHNCLGCNLAEVESQFISFLKQYKRFNSENESFTLYILLSYILMERIELIMKLMELPESYRLQHFRTFVKMRRWANFIKHPKSFMLVHHPSYIHENDPQIEIIKVNKLPIDTVFIETYYAGESKNKDLFKILENKTNVLVIFPNIEILTQSFCLEIRKFIDLIRDNSVFRHILNQKSTIENFYSREEDDERKTEN
jgi:hypothetical protein